MDGSAREVSDLDDDPARRYLNDAPLHERHAKWVEAAGVGSLTILDLFDHLPWFHGGNAAPWTAWRAFLCAMYALPMTAAELAIYQRCTGRRRPPSAPVTEAWLPTGRRARKTAVVSLIGVWHAAFRRHELYLAPGERAQVPLIAKDKADAQTFHSYVSAILQSHPVLASLLEGEPTAEEIRLSTGCDFRIRAVSLTAGRSKSVSAALLDEIAFWRTEGSAAPDVEVLRGIRPAMANVPGAVMVGLSSPYAKAGVLWEQYEAHYGREDDPVLVWQADTVTMHDSPQIRGFVAAETAKDPVSAAAEYGAQFRSAESAYVTEQLVRDRTVPGREALIPGVQRYHAFVDPSGGMQDSYALAIAHFDHGTGRVVLDYLREWLAPLDSRHVSQEAARDVRRYGLRSVVGDGYGGEFAREPFRLEGVMYEVSEEPRSAIYQATLPLLTGPHSELLDSARLREQLLGLRRRTGANGREIIDHKDGGHDDLANAACGAMWRADLARRMSPRKAPEPEPKTLEEQHLREVHASQRAKLEEQAKQGRQAELWRQRLARRGGNGGMPGGL